MSPSIRLNLSSSIVVPQAPHEVWSFLSRPENSPRWDRSVATVEALDDVPLGVGWGGRTTAPSGMQQEFRMTRWEPERLFAFDLLESALFREAVLTFTVDPVENRRSARKLAPLEPKLVLFGHGRPLRDTRKFVDFVATLPAD